MVICSNPVSADPLNFGHLQQNHLQQSFAATICSKNRIFAAKKGHLQRPLRKKIEKKTKNFEKKNEKFQKKIEKFLKKSKPPP